MTQLLLALSLAASVSGSTVVERIVAQVNGEIITETDAYRREQTISSELYRQQLAPEELSKRLAEARKSLLADMIQEALLLQKANLLGITIGAEQIDAVIDSIAGANQFPDREALVQALAVEGMTIEELRRNVSRRTLIEKVKQFEIAARIVITDDEIERHYKEDLEAFRLPERVRIAEIVLLTEGRSRDEALAQIGEIRQLLANGSDFDELATFFSQAPSADHGGDMGAVDVNTLSQEVREATEKLAPGEVSPEIETRFGFHLIKLVERQPRILRSLPEVRSEILAKLQQQRYQAALGEYMDGLIKKAYIRGFPAPDGARAYELPSWASGS